MCACGAAAAFVLLSQIITLASARAANTTPARQRETLLQAPQLLLSSLGCTKSRLAVSAAKPSLLQPVPLCLLHICQALWEFTAQRFQLARRIHPVDHPSRSLCPLCLRLLPWHNTWLLDAHPSAEDRHCRLVQEEVRHVRRLHAGIRSPKSLHTLLPDGGFKATDNHAKRGVHARAAVGEYRAGQIARRASAPTWHDADPSRVAHSALLFYMNSRMLVSMHSKSTKSNLKRHWLVQMRNAATTLESAKRC